MQRTLTLAANPLSPTSNPIFSSLDESCVSREETWLCTRFTYINGLGAWKWGREASVGRCACCEHGCRARVASRILGWERSVQVIVNVTLWVKINLCGGREQVSLCLRLQEALDVFACEGTTATATAALARR